MQRGYGRARTVALIATLLTVLALPAAVAAPAGPGSIIGRIVERGTGKIAHNVCARVDGRGRSYSHVTADDAQGRFHFSNLPLGRFSLSGFPCHGQDRYIAVRLDNPPQGEILTGAHPAYSARMSAGLGGFITGSVTDAATGRPVRCVGLTTNIGGTEVRNGRLRIAELGTGRYWLKIGGGYPSDCGSPAPTFPYATDFWPGTQLHSQAKTVSVRAGHTTSGINFELQRQGHVTGHITDGGTGLPVAHYCVQYDDGITDEVPADNPLSVWNATTDHNAGEPTDAQGNFDIVLNPGTYMIAASNDKSDSPTGSCGKSLFWFRGTADIAGAERVPVLPGEITSYVDITTPTGFITAPGNR